jgi:serine/threonine protein kinase
MSGSSGNLAEVDASLIWQQLSERIDGFIEAWQSGEPPELANFLPPAPQALRRMTLVEAIKVDLEYRWQPGGTPKMVEEYVAEFPELATDAGVPCDIIYEEYHIRKQRGESVKISEYCDRFPAHVEELRRLFRLESPEQTTAMMPAERPPVFEAGQTVDDFDLLAALGKGAFATVFLARQRSMQRLVALKISRDRGFEPQTLAQLDHPHIVRVFDQRQMPEFKLRLLYMQYIAGGTLQSVVEYAREVPASLRSGATFLEAIDKALERRGEQPPSDSMARYRLQRSTWPQVVCWLGGRLAAALAYAHQRGVLHRDVKPANVLVGADGHPKVADFNISFSKLDGATPAAYFGGSLAYMSPEQLEACDPAHSRQPDELDGRSDVYSLGVMLWELLTLKRPFDDSALAETWSSALSRMTNLRRAGIGPEARGTLPADCPRSVSTALLKCLEPDVDKRYASAGELARQLDLCLQPRAHALFEGAGDWRAVFKRHPVTTTLTIGLLPNFVMCVLNVLFNGFKVMPQLSEEQQRVFFDFQIITVNLVSYTIGLGYICYTRMPMFRTLARLARGEKAEPPSDEMLRRCLKMGQATGVVTAALWTIVGIIIPAWLAFADSANPVPQSIFTAFILSLLLSGMIAATQSHHLVTYLCVHYCCPWLLKARPVDAREVSDLAALAQRGRVILGLTFSLPFVALIAVLLLSAFGMLTQSDDRVALGALCGVGIVGCALAYVLDLSTRADLTAFAGAMNPGGEALTDTRDSFLTGSR